MLLRISLQTHLRQWGRFSTQCRYNLNPLHIEFGITQPNIFSPATVLSQRMDDVGRRLCSTSRCTEAPPPPPSPSDINEAEVVGPVGRPESNMAEKAQEVIRAELDAMTGSNLAHLRLQSALEISLRDMEELLESEESVTDTNNSDDIEQLNKEILESMQTVAEAYWNLGMLHEAQEQYEQLLSRLMERHTVNENNDYKSMPDHPEISKALHTIGSIQARLKNYVESEKWLIAALEMKKRIYGGAKSISDNQRKYHYEIGKSLNALALLEVQRADDYEEGDDKGNARYLTNVTVDSLRILEEAALNYRFHKEPNGPSNDNEGEEEDILGPMANHPDLASIYENIAMLYRKHNQHSLAIEKYTEALRIRLLWKSPEALAQDGDEKIASLKMSIGDCLCGDERFDEAAEMYKEALKLHLVVVKQQREQFLGEKSNLNSRNEDDGTIKEMNAGNLETSGTAMESVLRHNLGMIHAHAGRHDEALVEYQSSIQIKKDLAGETHPEVAKTLNAIGALYGTMGNTSSALAHFREALHIYRMHSKEWGDGIGDDDIDRTIKNIELVENTMFKNPFDGSKN